MLILPFPVDLNAPKMLKKNFASAITAFLLINSHFMLAQNTSRQEWFPFQKENKKWCYVSSLDGSVLGNLEFDSVTGFWNQPVARVMNKRKWGVVDTSGKMIAKTAYSEAIVDFSAETIFLRKQGSDKTGLCNFQGTFINPFRYEVCEYKNERNLREPVSFSDCGEFVTPVSFIHIENKPVYVARKKRSDEAYVVISRKGVTLLDADKTKGEKGQNIYYYLNDDRIVDSYAIPFSATSYNRRELVRMGKTEGKKSLFALDKETGYSVIDASGTELLPGTFFQEVSVIMPFVYHDPERGDLSVFKFKKMLRWGVMDENGRELIPAEYTAVDFHNGQIYCRLFNGRSIVYDASLIVLPAKHGNFFEHDRFLEGYDRIQSGKQQGVAKVDGAQIIEPKWDHIYTFNNTPLFICRNFRTNHAFYDNPYYPGETAVYDGNGKLIFRRDTEDYRGLSQRLAVFETSGKVELVDVTNGTVIACKEIDYRSDPGGMYRKSYHIGHYRFSENVLMFYAEEGWTAFDTLGKVLLRSSVEGAETTEALSGEERLEFDKHGRVILRSDIQGFENAEALFLENRNLGIHYYTIGKAERVIETGGKVIRLNVYRIAYEKLDNRIYCYAEDSMKIYSTAGDRIFSMRKSYSNNAAQPIRKLFANTQLDSLYLLSEGTDHFLLDYHFRPLIETGFQKMQGTRHNIIATDKNNREYLLLDNGKPALSKAYVKIEEYEAFFICHNESSFDLYDSRGKLRFEGASNLKIEKDYISFRHDRRKVWMNYGGKVYRD